MSSGPPGLSVLLRSAAEELFHADGKLPRTLRSLLVRPGQLGRAELSGGNAAYIRPVRLYVVINFLFFLLIPLLNTEQFRMFSFNLEGLSSDGGSRQLLVEKQREALGLSRASYAERFNAHLRYNQPAWVALLLPLFALFLKLGFLRTGRHYVEHLIFSLHFLSYMLLSLLVVSLLFRILSLFLSGIEGSIGLLGGGLVLLFLLGLLLHMILAMRRFYGIKLWKAVTGALVLLPAFFLCFGLYAQFLFFYTLLAIR